jgi:hypothetical protein
MEKLTANTAEKSEEQIRAEQGENLVDFLKRTSAYEYAQNLVQENESTPDFNTFKDILIRINGIVRNIPIKKRHLDGDGVEISGFVDTVNVPRQEDKEDLLRYAYDAVPRMSREDVKYVLPAVVNAAHSFADGNGRTSRTLHLLLREHASEEECFAEIKKAVGEDGRYDSLDINPGRISGELEHEVLKQHGWKFTESGDLKTLGPIESGIASIELKDINKDTPEGKAAKDFFKLYGEDVRYGLTAIYMLLGDERAEDVSSVYHGTKRISPLKMIQTLTPDDWIQITNNFYQLKKEHVKELVDIFVEPNMHMLPDNSGSIRDYFITRIEKEKKV